MPRNNPPLIAVVDHEPAFLRLMEHILASQGYRTAACSVVREAHEWILKEQPDLVILDTWLEARDDGWSVLQTLWLDEGTSHIPILICSSDRVRFEERVAELGGRRVGIVHKPFKPDALLQGVRHLVFDNTQPGLGAYDSDMTPQPDFK